MPGQRPEESGEALLRAAVTEGSTLFGARLQSAFALGSLAHGGFEPLVSDVDLALVVDRIDDATATTIDHIGHRVRHRYAAHPDTAHPDALLAQRLSIFWSDWDGLRTGAGTGRFPATDRLDLIDSGRVLFGPDRRDGIARPTRDELLVDSATFATTRFSVPGYLRPLHAPEELVRAGRRATTKAVLFPVRLRYTAATGLLGHNDAAVDWYLAADLAGQELVAAAAAWRHGAELNGERADTLLRESVLPLYVEFVTEFRRRLSEIGRLELAEEMARLGDLLTRG